VEGWRVLSGHSRWAWENFSGDPLHGAGEEVEQPSKSSNQGQPRIPMVRAGARRNGQPNKIMRRATSTMVRV